MTRDGDWWKEGLPDTEGTMLPQVFPVVCVTEHVHQMILELEQAASGLSTCSVEEIGNAHAHLGAARSTLYRYLQSIERLARVTGRTHIKRF